METGVKAHILLVDDNASLNRTLALVLERKGYAVTTAKDGPAAIEKVKDRAFDIIFMDIKMPLMDGVETYGRIKTIRPDSVVIMMTAYAVEELARQALEEGAYAVLHKPMDIARLPALIEEVTQAKRGELILVVDDSTSICTTLKQILATRGYRVNIAHTGEEAISMAQNEVYGILLIDLKLPTLNGLETYLAIKAINPAVVAIMITGYRREMADLVESALRNDAYTCLHKPVDIEQLLHLVEEIWTRKQKTG
ncbi:MAG: response regulator [Anaerolineae bacterium]|nr:response regulator [Anaerolineae bacterium]